MAAPEIKALTFDERYGTSYRRASWPPSHAAFMNSGVPTSLLTSPPQKRSGRGTRWSSGPIPSRQL